MTLSRNCVYLGPRSTGAVLLVYGEEATRAAARRLLRQKARQIDSRGLLIFDLDGTLLDCVSVQAECFARVLSLRFAIDKHLVMRAYYLNAGSLLSSQIRAAIAACGSKPPRDTVSIENAFWDELRGLEYHPFPDVDPLLRYLHERGYVVAISSGTSPELLKIKTVTSGIVHYIDIALGTETSNPMQGKGLGHWRKIVDVLDTRSLVLRKNAVFVGDTLSDVTVAHGLGIPLIVRRVPRQPTIIRRKADVLVKSLWTIAEMLMGDDGGVDLPVAVAFRRKRVVQTRL
jgi:phosphoglycolate phosphatase-like HAD superfamily hydrolase